MMGKNLDYISHNHSTFGQQKNKASKNGSNLRLCFAYLRVCFPYLRVHFKYAGFTIPETSKSLHGMPPSTI